MKFQVLSDLHLEFFRKQNNKIKFLESLKTDCDYVLLAGDISTGNNIIDDYNLVADILGPMIFIAGNHEYYHSSFNYVNDVLQYDIHGVFLNNKSVKVGDVTIIGGTGWNEEYSAYTAKQMNDYRVIKELKENPLNSLEWCTETYNKFNDMLDITEGKIICLTHNAPLKSHTPKQYKGDILNIFFSNNWEKLFDYDIQYWISGHQHASVDYTFNNTRCIENSCGYLYNITSDGFRFENESFIKNLIIEL